VRDADPEGSGTLRPATPTVRPPPVSPIDLDDTDDLDGSCLSSVWVNPFKEVNAGLTWLPARGPSQSGQQQMVPDMGMLSPDYPREAIPQGASPPPPSGSG